MTHEDLAVSVVCSLAGITAPNANVFFLYYGFVHFDVFILSLHDALPIFCYLIAHLDVVGGGHSSGDSRGRMMLILVQGENGESKDRKSTCLNSSHVSISYAVFCLKQKNNIIHSFPYV